MLLAHEGIDKNSNSIVSSLFSDLTMDERKSIAYYFKRWQTDKKNLSECATHEKSCPSHTYSVSVRADRAIFSAGKLGSIFVGIFLKVPKSRRKPFSAYFCQFATSNLFILIICYEKIASYFFLSRKTIPMTSNKCLNHFFSNIVNIQRQILN